MRNVVVLPVIKVERHDDARFALKEIFGGRVSAREVEALLTELHRRGLRIVGVDGDGDRGA